MKKLIPIFFVLCCFSFLFLSCDKIEENSTYRISTPVYKSLGEVRKQEIKMESPVAFGRVGKIYSYKDYVLINELEKGIHFYDNSNPAKPTAIGFLPILGNVDMAVKDDVLYADSYVDLLVFDIKQIQQPKLLQRDENRFSTYLNQRIDVSLNERIQVPVDYKDTIVQQSYLRTYNPWIKYETLYFDSNSSGSGQGGSLARFTIAKEHLYAIDIKDLFIYNVKEAAKPRFVKNMTLFNGIETLFPYKDKLFVGSTTGMVIFDIRTPEVPQQLSVYSHIRACDPVVVDDKYAYVTLRAGSFCGGSNVLEVIDIQDPRTPKLQTRYPMANPYGLAKVDSYLYVCDGVQGLKTFDARDVMKISDNLLERMELPMAYDLIPGPKSLLVVHQKGLSQYDYTNRAKLKLISEISIPKIR